MSAPEAIAKIQSFEPHLRRPFKPDEVAAGVAKVYSYDRGSKSKREYTSKWPVVNLVAQQAVIHDSGVRTLEELRGRSQPIPTDFVADYVVDSLFPGDPLLCIAKSPFEFGTMRRSSVRGQLTFTTLIVPSPMVSEEGPRKSDGEMSAHTEANTGPRKYIVTEFDGGLPFNYQVAIIWHLSGGAPLVCVCFSGGKSLHAWFNVEGHPEATVLRFFRYAVTLGADSATWSRSQFCRLPGGYNHDKEAIQQVHYLNPGVQWAELPEPPKTEAGFPWDIRSGKDDWTNDSGVVVNLSDPPLIDWLMRKCEVGTLVGGAKTAKTWFVLLLALSVAMGIPFLGRKSYKAKTLYLDYELKPKTFLKRLCMLATAQPEDFYYQCLRGAPCLPTIDQIADLIIIQGIELLVVDSLYRTGWLTEENSNDSTGRELSKLQQLATKTNCTILVVDHTAKGGGNDRSAVDASRGASTKGGFFDFIFVLRATEKGEDKNAIYAVLDPVLRDWPRTEDLPLISFLWSPLRCDIQCVGKVSRDDSERLESRILDWLGGCEAPVGIKTIGEALGAPETTIRKSVDRLVSGGKVIREKDPQHSQRLLFRLPAPEAKAGYPPNEEGVDDVPCEVPDVESGGNSSAQV